MGESNQVLVGGRYRVLGQLGKGAMGVVFVAHDPVLDRQVAIKQMSAEFARDKDSRRRFLVEARAAARLNHPHIITIHELQEANGEIYLVMELLEGRSVASLLQAQPGPLPLDTVLDVMVQVCDGLDYAHQHAVVHRDIKPANIFVTNGGVVKVLDFGVARLGSVHITATGVLVGTPDYMSPEQVRGDEVDGRADVWAVGAVLYQLLSGTKPFTGQPVARLLAAIAQAPHVPLHERAPQLPTAVCDLVDRMLSKSKADRPASAALVRDELRAALGSARPQRRETDAPPAAPAVGHAPSPGPEDTLVSAAPNSAALPGPAGAAAVPAAPAGAGAAGARNADSTLAAAPSSLPPPLPPAPDRASALPPVAVGPIATRGPAASTRGRRLATGLAVVLLLLVGTATATWLFFGARLAHPSTASPAGPVTRGPEGAPLQSPPPPAGDTSRSTAAAAAPEQATAPAELPSQPLAVRPVAPATGAGRTGEGATAAAPATRATIPPESPAKHEEKATRVETAPPPESTRVAPPVSEPVWPGEPRAGRAAAGGERRTAEQLSEDTVAALSGRRGVSGDTHAAPDGVARLAAVKRITWVLEQYAAALERRDAGAVREYRPTLSAFETRLLAAQRVAFAFQDIQVDVDAAASTATATCRRKMSAALADGGTLEEQGTVTVSLARNRSGWTITDIR
jgi:eukaryotic-like serine/threonine-protein kinase